MKDEYYELKDMGNPDVMRDENMDGRTDRRGIHILEILCYCSGWAFEQGGIVVLCCCFSEACLAR